MKQSGSNIVPIAKPLRLDDQLCFALYAATSAVTRTYGPLLGRIGLTYPQYLVMLVLWQDGASTVGHIVKRLAMAEEEVAPLVGRLERAGLLERFRDPDDRQIVRILPTNAGIELEEAASLAQQSVVCSTGLTPDGLIDLRDELVSLTGRMDLPDLKVS